MLVLFTLAGCAPMGPFGSAEGEDPGSSVDSLILVEPSSIDFGTFDIEDDGALFAEATFQVRNALDQDALIHGHSEVIGSQEFSVKLQQGQSDPQALAAHQFDRYTVEFKPSVDGAYAGLISLDFGDAQVELQGIARAPRLAVPDSVALSTPLGCVQEHLLTVSNIGSKPLTVEPRDLSDPTVGVSWADEDALEIEPGVSADLAFTFVPVDEEAHVFTAPIQTNEPGDAKIRLVEVTAQGVPVSPVVESFVFETDLQLSLLLVADTRLQTAPYLSSASEQIEDLVDTLGSELADVNVAVVTGLDDGGCPLAGRFVNTKLDPTSAEAAIALDLLTPGTTTDAAHLLDVALEAVGAASPGGCLDGFLRPGTGLQVVFLSGGTEESFAGAATLAESVSLSAEAKGVSSTTFSAFLPLGEGCGDTVKDPRFETAVDELNGVVWDLCTANWSDAWQHSAETIVPDYHEVLFFLDERAQPSSIGLIVDGVAVPSESFEYDDWLHAVRVRADAAIAADAMVDVSYLPTSACD